MLNPKFALRALALLVMSLWAQNAAALTCPAKNGDAFGDTFAQSFANATLDQCGITIGASNGHYVQNGDTGVQVLFFSGGTPYAPASQSLSCTGSTGTNGISNGIAATFTSQIYSTTCSLSYTDANGQTVSHSFSASTTNTSIGSSTVVVGHLAGFTVTNGWFERIAPTAVLSGLTSTIGNGAHTVTATFSEAVTGFTAADLSLTNATLSNFTGVSASLYTFDLTPIVAGAVAVTLPAAMVIDLANNGNTASNTLNATADFGRPGVTITGAPASINRPAAFNTAITFDEPVTGFVVSDITISGGSVIMFSGTGMNYSAVVSATGNGDLQMSVAAGVAQDAAGNDNTASATITVTNILDTQTSANVAHFMQSRANALLGNQPDLAGFLRGEAGQFAAEVTRSGGTVAFDSGYDAPIWARLNVNWSTDLGAEYQYAFGVIGGHKKLSQNLLLGGMLQFDHLSKANNPGAIQGTGWLFGPYFVAKLPSQPLYFEGSLLYGQTANTVSPLGTYIDAFTTERWLATLGVSGAIKRGQLVLVPFLDAKYTSDTQAAYIDGLGNPIASQTIGLAQVSAGLDFELALSAATDLNGGMSAVWSASSGSAVAAGYEGARAKLTFGMSHRFSDCNTLGLAAFYDGIGTPDFESFGADLKWQTCF